MKVAATAALLASLTVIGIAREREAGGQQFRSGVDLVSFAVIASDKKGLVHGLTKDDFTLLEDGQPQTIQFFKQGDVTERLPMRLGLLLDVSGSMGLDIEMARSAAIKFMNAVDYAQDVTLVDFDTEVRLARYRQDDYHRLIERIRGKKPDGWTALYDAIGVYVNGMAMEEGQKVLVLYTDGGDTRSRMTMQQVIDLLKMIDVSVYAIGFIEHQGSARTEQRMRLEQLARATGGAAYFPTSKEQIADAYGKILDELNTRYTLGYISSSTAKPGYRKVEIKVTNPAYKNIKIRARDGYYASKSGS